MQWVTTNGIIRRREAIAHGFTDEELWRGRRRGELVSIGHGAYAEADTYAPLDATARHRLAVAAVAARTTNGAAVSHASAAVLHGLDTWNLDFDRVHLTVSRRSGGKIGARRTLHAARLRPDEVTDIGALPVTTVTRTVIDLACTVGFEEAVVVGDHAIRSGATTPDDLQRALEQARGRTGISGARRVVAFLDGRSESVGESRSRVLLHWLQLPKPELQQPVHDIHGNLIGRVDMLWCDQGVVGEFDGMAKYSMVPGRTEWDVFRAEKAREDALRAVGFVVVRWNWADLSSPERLRVAIERAFAVARHYPRR